MVLKLMIPTFTVLPASLASKAQVLRCAQVALGPSGLLQGQEDSTAVQEDGAEPGRSVNGGFHCKNQGIFMVLKLGF